MNINSILNFIRKDILNNVYPFYSDIVDYTNKLTEDATEEIKELFNNKDYGYEFWSNNLEELILTLCENYSNNMIMFEKKFRSGYDGFLKDIAKEVSCTYKVNTKKIEPMLSLIDHSVCKQMKDFVDICISSMSEDIRNNAYILFNEKFEINRYEVENNETDNELDEFIDINNINTDTLCLYKIFSYKDMCNLAIKNGYEYKWSNGSHRVYEHSNSKRIVVIPSHELGIGLSKKIQKQIFNNKISIN